MPTKRILLAAIASLFFHFTPASARHRDIKVDDFGAVGDGVRDDTAAVQAALDALTPGATLSFPRRASRYRITRTLTFSADRVTIEANGSTLVSSLGTAADVLQNRIVAVRSDVVPSGDIEGGAATLRFARRDVEDVRVGDICVVNTSKTDPVSSSYRLGTIRRVTAVNGGAVTLDGPVTTGYSLASDAPTVNFRRPQRGFTLSRLNVELQRDGRQTAIRLRYLTDATIDDCSLDGVGGESHAGIIITDSFHVRVRRVSASHFRDTVDYSFGYGVQVAGHDLLVEESTLRDCKHGLVCGHNNYRSTFVRYERNFADDAMLDAHGGCEFVRMLDNDIVGVGATKGRYAVGAWARGRHSEISGNTIVAARPSAMPCDGIRVLEIAIDSIVLSHNTILGCAMGIAAHQQLAPASRYLISGNRISGGGIRVRDASSTVIVDNVIDSDESGITVIGGDDLVVSGNQVTYGAHAWGVGILLDEFDSHVARGAVLRGNGVRATGARASSAIRVKSGYDDISIIDNVLDSSAARDVPPLQSAEDRNLTRYRFFGNVDTPSGVPPLSPPHHGACHPGDIVYETAPTPGGYVGRVCTGTGPVGSWRPFGSIAR